MNVLVIGGTRFIGAAVVRQLVQQGHSLTVYHRGQHQADMPAVVRHVLRPEAGMPVLRFPAELLQPSPDVVIHMIAMGERDAGAAADFFRGHCGRMLWISSGDVYRAYGVFIGKEPGPVEPGLLREDSSLRTALFPYRDPTQAADDLANIYEKVFVERIALSTP